MRIITEQGALSAFISVCAKAPYVTVDTEFLRERTYWPQLCLIQMAAPGGEDQAAIIDPLANGLDLTPVYELMANEAVVKVFHAARQDVEIFVHDGDVIPSPLFDTQVAAMVCGYGDQVGYETLVRRIAEAKLDKSSRFTDWSRRPLSDKQLRYALADVTHLRQIYEQLSAELERTGRAAWVAEEMETLTRRETYVVDPEHAWRRLKTRSSSGKFLSVARQLAKWREEKAQARNIPRNRLMKDDALLEVASNRPATMEELNASRLLLREARKGDVAREILAAVAAGVNTPKEDWPDIPEPPPQHRGTGHQALMELLRVLLKAQADHMGVAQRLIASADDLQRIAGEDAPDVPAMRGWRREAFGEVALRLKRGEVALSANASGVRVIDCG